MIENLLGEIITRNGHAKVLDVGGRRDYWNLLSSELTPKTSITLLNIETELDVGRQALEAGGLQVSYCQGDGCNMPAIADRSFDLVHSNSTIEHVGSLQRMSLFAREIRRVGNAYFIQTPYLWFPLDPHYGVPFVHWLPGPTRAVLLHRFNLGYSRRQPDYLKALETADHTQIVDQTLMTQLFPDGTLIRERFALMTKSLMLIRRPVFE